MRWVGLIGVLLATPAAAQDDVEAKYSQIMISCYSAAETRGDRERCIGAMSDACRAGEEGGETTLGIVECALAETRAWDALLNVEYQATREFARSSDTSNAEHFPEFAKLEESLLQAQRAWIAFRDAECGLAYAYWGSGSMRNIASSNCQMSMTALRTIDLRGLREEP